MNLGQVLPRHGQVAGDNATVPSMLSIPQLIPPWDGAAWQGLLPGAGCVSETLHS